MRTAKKLIALILALALMAFATGCTNPNASPTDKVGGYHTAAATVRSIN